MIDYKLVPGKLYYNLWVGARVVVLSVDRYSEVTIVVEMLRGKDIFCQYYSPHQLKYYFGDPL